MDNKCIKIYVALKHVGNVAKKVKVHPLLLNKVPHTFCDLIEESVKSCIRSYKNRINNSEIPSPFTDEEYDSMRQIGKFAFGVNYNKNNIDEEKSVSAAIEAVKDGIVRVFKNNDEITNLDTEINISEGDVFTFVRLTMLSGRMW